MLVLVVPRGGGCVCPYYRFALGVGFGPLRPVRRWFRLSLMLVRVWWWAFAFGLGFGRVRWFRFIFTFVRLLVLADPGKKVKKSRCKLAVFK